MSQKFIAIPSAPLDSPVRQHLEALKENVERLRGVRGVKIKPLASTATLADVINKINELIDQSQA